MDGGLDLWGCMGGYDDLLVIYEYVENASDAIIKHLASFCVGLKGPGYGDCDFQGEGDVFCDYQENNIESQFVPEGLTYSKTAYLKLSKGGSCIGT